MPEPSRYSPTGAANLPADMSSRIDNVWKAFAQQAREQPERPALLLAEGALSYGELAERVGRYRAALTPLAPAGQPVGVWTEPPLSAYPALLAAMAERAPYVPINARFPLERNLAVVEESGLRHILSETQPPELQALIARCEGRVQRIGPHADAMPMLVPAITPEKDELAYLLFTSGSTGRPKGVPITHRALRHFLSTVTDPADWSVGPSDVFLQMFELTFDLSVYSFFTPMVLGAACAPVPSGGVQYLQMLDTLERHGVTVALMVPSALAYLKPYFDEIELPALRYSLFCGEALPDSLAAAWAARLPQAQIENVYGPTEATIFCTRYVYGSGSTAEALNGVVPIGQPMRGVDTLLLADSGAPADEGELVLGGPQVTPGYWQNPAKNAEAFVIVGGQHYYRTGDRCRRSPSGQLLYLGRADQQVKVDGYRVELGEIEHHARALTGAHLAVVAVEVGGHTQLVLYLECWSGEARALAAALAQRLPPYMVPARIEGIAALPLNANGNIDRPALRQRALERPA